MKTEKAAKGTSRRGGARVGDTKLTAPVTLFAQIEATQHEALRAIAFDERRSIADVVRAALGQYLAQRRRPGGRRGGRGRWGRAYSPVSCSALRERAMWAEFLHHHESAISPWAVRRGGARHHRCNPPLPRPWPAK
jgi:hypothetical protein